MKGFWFSAILWGGIFITSGSVFSCANFSASQLEISRLDSLSLQINSMELQADSLMRNSLYADTIQRDLRFIQQNFKGEMREEMAEELNDYGLLGRNFSSMSEFSQTLRKQIDSSGKQVLALHQALSEGATHDAADNKLTGDYVKTLVKNESTAIFKLQEVLNNQRSKSGEMTAEYYRMRTRVEEWKDSIQTEIHE